MKDSSKRYSHHSLTKAGFIDIPVSYWVGQERARITWNCQDADILAQDNMILATNMLQNGSWVGKPLLTLNTNVFARVIGKELSFRRSF